MQDRLVNEAARLLDLEPTRSLEADTLYRRTRSALGISMPLPLFVDCLRAQPQRFAVVTSNPALDDAAHWDERERSTYQNALIEAGTAIPIVALAEQPAEPFGDAPAPTGATALLGDMHDAVTRVLHATRDDARLHAAVVSGIEELHAVRRVLQP